MNYNNSYQSIQPQQSYGTNVQAPQIMSQAQSSSSSLAKMKTIGDIKLNHNIRANQAEGDNTRTIQSMISNMSFAGNNQRSNSRLGERKTNNGCLS